MVVPEVLERDQAPDEFWRKFNSALSEVSVKIKPVASDQSANASRA